MDGQQEERTVDALSRVMKERVPDLMRRRLVAGLSRADPRVVVQADVDAALRDLAGKAPDHHGFKSAVRNLSAFPSERDQMVLLLSKISQNSDLLARISASSSTKGHSSAAGAGGVSSSTRTPVRRPADPGLSLQGVDTHMSDLTSPGNSEPTEGLSPRASVQRAMQGSTRAPPNMSVALNDNALFEAEKDPMATDPRWNPLVTQSLQATATTSDAVVTLPDAGNVFAPTLADVIRGAAPEHMQQAAEAAGISSMHLAFSLRSHAEAVAAVQNGKPVTPEVSLEGLPELEQQRLIVADLLSVFTGSVAEYAQVTPAIGPGGSAHIVYTLTEHCDCCSPLVKETAAKMLCIGEYVVLIKRYMHSRAVAAFGVVCNAFAEALRAVVDDWQVFICSLEHTLQGADAPVYALWSYVESSLSLLRFSAAICAEASAAKFTGASLLNHLHAHANAVAGDPRSVRVIQRYLHAAARPYFAILSAWISTGTLHDRFSEFLVEEVPAGEGGRGIEGVWDGQFVVRQREEGDARVDDVPSILEAASASILQAGRNWRVLNSCEHSGGAAPAADADAADAALEFDPHGNYLAAISAHCSAACAALLRLLLDRYGLVDWLQTMKEFFLLDKADFLTVFFGLAHADLHTAASKVSTMRLRSALDAAVRGSCLAENPRHERVSLTLEAASLVTLHAALFKKGKSAARERSGRRLNAIEHVGLTVDVESPISIVLSHSALLSYQYVFKHLTLCKATEAALATRWFQLRCAKRLGQRQPEEAGTMMAALALLNRMLFFVQRYLHYVFLDIINPQWQLLLDRVAAATSLDEVIEAHETCLARILRCTLIERLRPLTAFGVINEACGHFCNAAERRIVAAGAAPGRGALSEGQLLALAGDASFQKAITECGASFDKALVSLRKDLRTHKVSVLAKATADGGNAEERQHEADMVQAFLDQTSIAPFTPAQDAVRAANADLARAGVA